MENKKGVNRILTKIQIISVIIWTILLIISGYNKYENMNITLIGGASAEFLLLSTSFLEIKSIQNEKTITNM
jgi:hypothetical protein